MSTSSSSSAPRTAGSRPTRPAGGGRGGEGGGPRRWAPARRKVCRFCVDRVVDIDYKNITILRNYVTERGKMIAARSMGNCAKHQRMLTQAVKRSRNIALLPFAVV